MIHRLETSGRLGDHGSAATVAHEHRIVDAARGQTAENPDHRKRIAVQVGERFVGCSMPGEIHGERGDAPILEFGLKRGPAPGSVPSTMHEDDVM